MSKVLLLLLAYMRVHNAHNREKAYKGTTFIPYAQIFFAFCTKKVTKNSFCHLFEHFYRVYCAPLFARFSPCLFTYYLLTITCATRACAPRIAPYNAPSRSLSGYIKTLQSYNCRWLLTRIPHIYNIHRITFNAIKHYTQSVDYCE